VWSVACGLGVPGFALPIPGLPSATPGIFVNCPDTTGAADPRLVGPDYDFAQGPMLFSGTSSRNGRSLVGAGAKSGIFWAFRAKDSRKVWSTQVSPGGVTGGMQWGSATDGRTLYVSASNAGPSLNGGGAGARPWTLLNGQVVYSGGWAAIDAESGEVEWTTADPYGSRAEGPVTLSGKALSKCRGSIRRLGCRRRISGGDLLSALGITSNRSPNDCFFLLSGPLALFSDAGRKSLFEGFHSTQRV
jgi:polyvinyl alcohol dehydrogenase (cytochrome)